MIFVGLFFFELFTLFFLAKQLTLRLSLWLYHVTKSQQVSVFFLSLLFFPGTVLHELAHAFMAIILFVPVGKMEFIPKIHEGYVKLGSVAIGETDFFRRFLIGVAPFLFGTTILLLIFFYMEKHVGFSNYGYLLLIFYIVFEISNTMFSSKKDMEGAIELLLTLGIATLIALFAGFTLPFIKLYQLLALPSVSQIFYHGSIFLLIPLGIDLICLVLLYTQKKYKKTSPLFYRKTDH